MNVMLHAFETQSPRLAPRPVPLAGRLIGMAAPALFILLATRAFIDTGLIGWAVGIAYILYDTALLLFTAASIRSLGKAPAARVFSSEVESPNDSENTANKENTAPAPSPRRRESLGVIVAAHNEAPVLGITIDTLAAQAEPPELILLADDGSTDASADVLKRLYGLDRPAAGEIGAPSPVLPSLRWLRLPHGGKARALNAAIQRVDTELVLTVDADTLLGEGAISAMREAFAAEPELVAATGVLRPICGKTPMARLFQWFQSYEYVRNFLSRYAWMKQGGLLLVSGAFAAFRREAVLEVGGFDPACMVEDYELIHRLHRHAHDTGQDWRVRVVGAAFASTDAPANPLAFLRQRRRWFGGFLQTQRWNRDMVGNRHYGRLGTRMLPVKALDTLQPVYGLTAFAVLIALILRGRLFLSLSILAIMAVKVAIDLTFHLWSIGLYKRWTGQREGLGLGAALVASFAEPFTFQLLRHAGAVWGWVSFLSGGGHWGRQHRTALSAPEGLAPLA